MTDIRRILIAADKFKGSLTAVEVAQHVAGGLRRAAPDIEIDSVPVADGGDGTVEAAVLAGFSRRTLEVTGPLGAPVRASFALRGTTAVVEMAEASGSRRLPNGTSSPLTATTHGTGELIGAALDSGVRTVVLGVGGSATTDGGAGMLTALGARFLDASGDPIGPGGAGLAVVASADLSGLDPRISATEFILASDVDNPLTGPKGAAAVYGPQKGATDEDVAVLDRALRRFVATLHAGEAPHAAALADAPGAGAAGGLGFGALVGLRASRTAGIDIILDTLGFSRALAKAQLVITGEGSLDSQTLSGKAPLGVAQAARRRGLDVVAVCGRLGLSPGELGAAGIRRAYPLTALQRDPRRCMAEAGPLLARVSESIARDFVVGH